jgi:hypothetical protein
MPGVGERTGTIAPRLLETLVARGSDDAVAAFDQLIKALPERSALHDRRAPAAPTGLESHRPRATGRHAGRPHPARDGCRRRPVGLAGLGLALLLTCLVIVSVSPVARAIVASLLLLAFREP